MKRIRSALITGGLLLAPGAVQAHSFKSGAGSYQDFLEGGKAIIAYPGVLLPLAGLGLLLALWDREGMIRAWPALIAGLLLGVPLGAVSTPGVALALIGLGTFVAALAALLSRHWRAEALGLAAVTGALAMATSLEGHGFLQLPVFVHLGLFVTMNLVVAVSAGLVRVSTDRFPADWMRIGWRVAASWIAAVMVLYLAFVSRGG